MRKDSVSNKASKGFLSFLSRNLLGRIVGVGAMVILARELTPYEFGLVSITEVLISIVGVTGSAGIPEFLLAHRKENDYEIYRAAFWFNTILASVVAIIFLAALPFWANYQNDLRIVNVGILVCCYYIFTQLQSIPKAILSRNLEFDALVKIQNPFIVLIPLGKVMCAYAGLGVYSLVLPTVVFTFIQGIIFFWKVAFKPGLSLYVHRWSEIFKFSKSLMGVMVISRLSSEGDKLILASVLGLSELGIYNLAYQLANLYPSNVLSISNNVLSATLPKFATNVDLLKSKFYSFLEVFAFVSIPIQLVLIVCAGPLIEVVYGVNWDSAIIPFQILSIFSIFRTLTSSTGSVLNTLRKPNIGFRLVLFYTPFHLIASYIGSLLGVVGLSLGIVLLKLVYLPIEMHILLAHMNSSFREWLSRLSQVLTINFIGLVVGFILVLVLNFYEAEGIFKLLATVCLYFVFYYVLLRFFYVAFLTRISAKIYALNPAYSRIFDSVFAIK